MARRYAIAGNATNTQSATLPLVTVIGAATIRPKVYDITFGSDATPADNAGKFAFQRCTTTGTVGSSITPQALDPGDPAALCSSGLAVFSVGPTLTASAFVLQWAQNQRATFRWVAAPNGELVIPATASNGLALMALVTTTAVNYAFVIHVEE